GLSTLEHKSHRVTRSRGPPHSGPGSERSGGSRDPLWGEPLTPPTGHSVPLPQPPPSSGTRPGLPVLRQRSAGSPVPVPGQPLPPSRPCARHPLRRALSGAPPGIPMAWRAQRGTFALSPSRLPASMHRDDTAPLRGGGLRVRLRRHVTTHRAGAQQSPAQSPRGHRAAAGPGPPAPRPEQARHCVSPEASATAAKPLPKALGAPSLRRWRHVSEAVPRAPGSVTFLRGAVSGPGTLLRPAEGERTEATHVSPATWKSPRRRAASGAGRRGGARRPQPVCSRPSPAPGPPVSGPSGFLT
ncbi:hypothetical protein EI555_010567, partial [Monodon monoceros]